MINLTITVGEDTFTYDQSYYIIATGTKFINGNYGECSLRIDNISKQTRDFITTKTTLWRTPRTQASMSLSVGRKSTGVFQIFNGNVMICSPTQPPDIGLTIRGLGTSSIFTVPQAFTAPAMSSLQSICIQVAFNNGLALIFETTKNPMIENYQFTGTPEKQIELLNNLNVIAYKENGNLIVKDMGTARKIPTIQINTNNGMVGVPEVTDVGARAKMLIKNNLELMAPCTLTSASNPAANGNYSIYKLSYEISSRETPFYWIVDLLPVQNNLTASQ